MAPPTPARQVGMGISPQLILQGLKKRLWLIYLASCLFKQSAGNFIVVCVMRVLSAQTDSKPIQVYLKCMFLFHVLYNCCPEHSVA